MKHIIVFYLSVIGAASCNVQLVLGKPMHLKRALLEHEQTADRQLLEHRKQQLCNYYAHVYEYDVYDICAQALEVFKRHCVTARSLIIFDIDDTVVYSYQWFDDIYFIWSQQPQLIESRTYDKPCIIRPVAWLYKKLVRLGYTIIFLSARDALNYDATVHELKKAGYRFFERIILMPEDCLESVALWKLKIRMQLAVEYDIVGCVADRAVDFEGGYTGYEVRLPNYLY